MYYSINGIRLFVKDEGQGNPALLFLHFYGGSSATWRFVTGMLKEDFRCISYDSRGWGNSDKPETGYSIKELADDTLGLISALKLNNYVLIGHSMGGKIAQYIAAQKPPGLKKLILVAPSPAVPTILPTLLHEAMKNAYTSEDAINATIDHMFNASDLEKGTRFELVSSLKNHSESSRLGWPDIALLDDVSAGVDHIAIPTLIIAGENDIIDPPARLEAEVLQKIPGSKMVVIPAVGHLAMLQEPAIMAGHIRDFVNA